MRDGSQLYRSRKLKEVEGERKFCDNDLSEEDFFSLVAIVIYLM